MVSFEVQESPLIQVLIRDPRTVGLRFGITEVDIKISNVNMLLTVWISDPGGIWTNEIIHSIQNIIAIGLLNTPV